MFSLFCFYDAKKISDKREKKDKDVSPEDPISKESNRMYVDGKWVPDPSFKVDKEVPPQDSSDKIMQIEKLGELKDKGLLTEEEFQKEKDKIL